MSDLILQITCWQQLPQQNLHLKKIIIESVDSYLLLTNNIHQKLIPGIHCYKITYNDKVVMFPNPLHAGHSVLRVPSSRPVKLNQLWGSTCF